MPTWREGEASSESTWRGDFNSAIRNPDFEIRVFIASRPTICLMRRRLQSVTVTHLSLDKLHDRRHGRRPSIAKVGVSSRYSRALQEFHPQSVDDSTRQLP